jgi:hypothetical protein
MYDPSAPIEAIEEEQNAIGVVFPESMVELLKIMNGFEYISDWSIYSVLNPKNPKAKYGYFRSENKRSSYDYIDPSLLKIASDGYGNHLVLKSKEGIAEDIIYRWDHETNALKRSAITFEKLAAFASKKIEKVKKAMSRSMNKRPNKAIQKGRPDGRP